MRFKVNATFLILLGLALAATALAYSKSPALAWQGATSSAQLFIRIAPSIMVGFLLGGMVQVLLPRELVAAYAGEDSGFVGLTLATIAGSITPGGPFVQFPLVASLWKAGTGVGPLSAYLTAWALLGLQRVLVWELPIMGWQYTTARMLGCLPAPYIVGLLAGWFFRRFYGA